LTEPKNSLVKQQIKLFAMDGIKLSYEEEALDYIVDKAVEYKLGARGLRSIMESIMIEAQYSAPSEAKDTLVITRQYAEEQLEKQKEKLSNVG
ncbi:MAG: ATP-dependent Clp protease ATP-binding subunit ClpX, partial [Bacteroidaceae bacterium]|jgi:ATP-dependent Clp protease ATP-binding subunit ClpX|nr:ATP-dependent Clp protease ATP-binding subunit ClpX [Bacteroidaceae bacterium]